MKHYVAISYLSKFQGSLKVHEYQSKLEDEQLYYGILTNEAGIQAILDNIKMQYDGKEVTVDIIYFCSQEVGEKSKEKREKFNQFYENYKKGNVELTSYIQILKKDTSEKNHEMNCSEELSEAQYYENRVKTFGSLRGLKVNVHKIPINENSNMIDANREQIGRLFDELERLKEEFADGTNNNYHIYIDSSGGPRDFSFLCILMIKMLQLAGYNEEKIIYSNINRKDGNEIISLSSTYDMLNITNGINEFIKYGKVSTLRESLGRKEKKKYEKEDSVEVLLSDMEKYSKSISICELNNIKDIFDCINKDMKKIEEEKELDSRTQIMKLQFPYIREKMGISNPKKQFLVLLDNYIKNGMIQQAITFYNEKMPEYLMSTINMLVIKKHILPKDIYRQRDKVESLLHGFDDEQIKDEANKKYNEYGKYGVSVYMLSNLDKYGDVTFPNGKKEQVIEVLKDYVVIREIRNHMDHVSKNTIMGNTKAKEFFCFEMDGVTSYFDCFAEKLVDSQKHLKKLS